LRGRATNIEAVLAATVAPLAVALLLLAMG
jgi:hypothetical protein